MKTKKCLLLLLFCFTLGTTSFQAFGEEPGVNPTFRLHRGYVQIWMNADGNLSQALLTALNRFPKSRYFRLVYCSKWLFYMGGKALYDRQQKTLRVECFSQTPEYGYNWIYSFRNVSKVQIQKLAQIKREQGESSPTGYFEELKGLGCPTTLWSRRRP